VTLFGDLLAGVARRMKVAWLIDRIATVAVAAAAALLAVLLAGRWVPLGIGEYVAWALAGLALAAVAARAPRLRVTPLAAARAADRGFAGRDQMATAIELSAGEPDGEVAPLQIDRAIRFASGRRAKDAVVYALPERRAGLAALLIVLAVLVSVLPNPADATVRLRRAEAAAVAEQQDLAERLAEEAAAKAATPEQEALAERLAKVAEELDKVSSVDEAQKAIDEAESELLDQLDPDALSKRAAVAGLERTLAQDPLPGSNQGDPAAEQLEALAEAAPSLTEGERREAAERLEALARGAESTNPELAEALREAAANLRAGRDASGALSRAAALQREAVSAAVNQDRVATSLATLGEMRDALERAQAQAQAEAAGESGTQSQSGQGEGEQPGGQPGAEGEAGQQGQTGSEGEQPGVGQGEGEGEQPGLGGQGTQPGQGSQPGGQPGQGSQPGPGDAGSTDGGVADIPDDSQSGQGSTSWGYNAGDQIRSGGVYDPQSFAATGERSYVSGILGEGDEELLPGERLGDGDRGQVLVPYQQVLPAYRSAFVRAVQTQAIPVTLRSLVRDYFAALVRGGSP